MITLKKIQSKLRGEMAFLKTRYHVKSVAVFGSFVYGTPRMGSDIDLLIEFKKTPDLFEFLHLETYLESVLGRRVDLVRKSALRKELRGLLKEVVRI